MGDVHITPRQGAVNGPDPVQAERSVPPEPPPAPPANAAESGQAATLRLSNTAKALGPRETLEERKSYLLEQLATPILPLKTKEEILKKLDAARKDGTIKPLIHDLARPPAEGGVPPLKQLFRKMGTPASQGISDLLILALSGGATVYDEWKRDKRADFLGILKAGKIDPGIIQELQAK